MKSERNLFWIVAVATLITYAFTAPGVYARGGGHGGGHGGGGHHGGEHNHHPYHPSHHHAEHHPSHHGNHHGDHHHDGQDHDHHYAHHHHDWHHGGWGSGFWGGPAVSYGLGYGYGNWGDAGYDDGGDTYVDNSTNVAPASDESNDSDGIDASDESADSGDDENSANDSTDRGFPTDDWPELGVVTYAGQYGGSQGQVVVRVVPNSGAAKAGIVPGDVILSFNGKPAPSADDLDSAFDNANGKFEIEVWDARTGRKSTLSGALDPGAASPQTNETAAIQPAQQ